MELYKRAGVLEFYTSEHLKSFVRPPHEACEFDGYGKCVNCTSSTVAWNSCVARLEYDGALLRLVDDVQLHWRFCIIT